MKVTMRLDYLDGSTAEVTASGADIMAVERKYGISFQDIVRKGSRIEWPMFMCWSALRRLDANTAEDFDAWAATIASMEEVDAESTRPTKRGRSRTASSS